MFCCTVKRCGRQDKHGSFDAGWSHFAQFTIAVVNKDPKKSKYSGGGDFTLGAKHHYDLDETVVSGWISC
jgi:hypothetical protein